MCILFVNPHSLKILKTIEALERVKFNDVIIVGNYTLITSIIENESIIIKSNIIDCCDDDLVCKCSDYITNETLVVFGDCIEAVSKKILGFDNNSIINYFYTIDFQDPSSYVFVANYSKKRHLDYEDKRKAITSIFEFMKSLGVKKSNVCLLTDKTVNSDVLEVNLIRMILKDELSKNVNILSPAKISEVFDKNSDCNIYNKNVNMLIFKNYEITKTFIETINALKNYKVASICNINEVCYINASEIKNVTCCVFSILLLSKYIEYIKNSTISYKYAN